MISRSLFVLVLAASVLSRPLPPHVTRWPRQTPAPTTPLTTKAYLWEMRWAANIDYGKFTPMKFQYYNDQFMQGNFERKQYDRCYEDFIRCNLAITHPYTVCGFRAIQPGTKHVLMPMSYCEVYHDNCMRGERFWRVLDFGQCDQGWGKNWGNLDTVPMRAYLGGGYHPYRPPPSFAPYMAYPDD